MILPLAGDDYAIFYQAADSDGWVTTVNFDGSAQPTKTDTWEFTTYGTWPMTVEVSDNLAGNGKVFCVLHGTAGDYNNLATIEVLNDGTITESLIDEAQLDAVRVGTGGIVHIAGGIYAAAYRGDGNDGLLKTFPVETIILATVSTDPAADVAANSSTLNGTLDDDGEAACDCGFEWGETVAYGNTTPTDSKVTGETFSQAISGLDPATTYHFRAFARNAEGTSYGADRTFTTEVAMSSLTTDPATGVGMVLANLNGTLDDDGGQACACGFEWGETDSYGNTTPTSGRLPPMRQGRATVLMKALLLRKR